MYKERGVELRIGKVRVSTVRDSPTFHRDPAHTGVHCNKSFP